MHVQAAVHTPQACWQVRTKATWDAQAWKDMHNCRMPSWRPAHLENGGCLQHFGHEGGHTPELTVARPDTRKHGVPHSNAGGVAGHPAADLGHQNCHSHLRHAHAPIGCA